MFDETALFERARATAEQIHPCNNARHEWVAITSELYEYLLCKDVIQQQINELEAK